MPFTFFHLGPGLFFGELFKKYINIFSILTGSVVLDLRPGYCLIAKCQNLHGLEHTFLIATVISMLLILLIILLKKPIKKFSEFFKIKQDFSNSSIAIGTLIGVYLHILLDSISYIGRYPFWPLQGNYFYNLFGLNVYFIYGFCIITGVISLILYYKDSFKK